MFSKPLPSLRQTAATTDSLRFLAAKIIVINSCFLYSCGPPAPIVLRAKANISAEHLPFARSLEPIEVTAAHLCGPLEHVSGQS